MSEEIESSEPETSADSGTIGRRKVLLSGLGLGAAAAFGGVLSACSSGGSSSNYGSSGDSETSGTGDSESSGTSGEPIKVGFLSDFSGSLANLGAIQFNCFELAVNQINADGGVDGRKLEIVKEDDGNDAGKTVEKATKLALDDEVTAVFGLITSLVRQAALTVLPKEKVPLFYTTYYEGALEDDPENACNPYLISTGQVPNQQIDPLVPYLTENVGTTYSVVGSDYDWPRGTSAVLKDLVEADGGEIVSETYFPFGTTDFGSFFQQLEKEDPDICWVTLAGADFAAFVPQYEQFGAKAKLVALPMDSVRTAANPGLGIGAITSHAYFTEIASEANQEFLKAYEEAYDENDINSIGEGAYNAAYLFKLAVEAADGSTKSEDWIPKLSEVTFEAPSGPITIDGATQHTVTNNFIAEVIEDGVLEIKDEQFKIDPIIDGCNLA